MVLFPSFSLSSFYLFLVSFRVPVLVPLLAAAAGVLPPSRPALSFSVVAFGAPDRWPRCRHRVARLVFRWHRRRVFFPVREAPHEEIRRVRAVAECSLEPYGAQQCVVGDLPIGQRCTRIEAFGYRQKHCCKGSRKLLGITKLLASMPPSVLH